MNRTQRDLILLATGIGIGVGLGMLLAPRSGQETREELRRATDEAAELSRDYWQRIRNRHEPAAADEATEAES